MGEEEGGLMLERSSVIICDASITLSTFIIEEHSLQMEYLRRGGIMDGDIKV